MSKYSLNCNKCNKSPYTNYVILRNSQTSQFILLCDSCLNELKTDNTLTVKAFKIKDVRKDFE